ncbi:ISSag8, transposase [Streptococcus sp. oral taxon 056 str. F0418]|nr:ISSag8, transposase [Streptococcus sp. oral taxon 056 str. F0418]
MKELYKKLKETIKLFFGTAKEHHNLRYSREKEKFWLTLVYLNIKKLVKWIANIPFYFL